MASFEPAVVELGKIVAPLKVDDTPKGQFYLVAKQIHEGCPPLRSLGS